MRNIFNKPQTYKAWNKTESKWVMDGWYICPTNGYPYWIASGLPARSLTVVRSTGITDIKGFEIHEGDLVVPVKFHDIPNLVEYVQHGFYRVKHHNGKKFFNALGSCQVKIIGNVFQHVHDFNTVRIGNVVDIINPSPTAETP